MLMWTRTFLPLMTCMDTCMDRNDLPVQNGTDNGAAWELVFFLKFGATGKSARALNRGFCVELC